MFQPGLDTRVVGDWRRHRFVPRKTLFGPEAEPVGLIERRIYHQARRTALRNPFPEPLLEIEKALNAQVHARRLEQEDVVTPIRSCVNEKRTGLISTPVSPRKDTKLDAAPEELSKLDKPTKPTAPTPLDQAKKHEEKLKISQPQQVDTDSQTLSKSRMKEPRLESTHLVRLRACDLQLPKILLLQLRSRLQICSIRSLRWQAFWVLKQANLKNRKIWSTRSLTWQTVLRGR